MDDGLHPNSKWKHADDTPPSGDSLVRSAVRAIRRGEGDAFRHLVELYQKRIFGLALMIVRDHYGAEEITQDAFVRAYKHLDRYDERRPFYPWLATITIRHAQTWLRGTGAYPSRKELP
jgi:RNA polymerase sigma-70 factor (ECF subfamily)